MLVLTRGQHEALCFKELGVRIKVLRLSGARVRLGVEAPRELTIVRDELSKFPTQEKDFCADCVFSNKTAQDRIRDIISHLLKANAAIDDRNDENAPEMLELAKRSLDDLIQQAKQVEAGCVREASCIRGLLLSGSEDCDTLLAKQAENICTPLHVLSDQEQALCLMRNAGVSYVVINMDCPKLNGRAILKTIRNEPSLKRLQVFALSDRPREDNDVPIGPDGCDEWFLKPLKRERLKAAIEPAKPK